MAHVEHLVGSQAEPELILMGVFIGAAAGGERAEPAPCGGGDGAYARVFFKKQDFPDNPIATFINQSLEQ